MGMNTNSEEESWPLLPSEKEKRDLLPVRYVLALMGSIGVSLALMMRSCLAIAITEMVYRTPKTNFVNVESCFGHLDGNLSQPVPYATTDPKFDWDEKSQGIILSSFYYGYILTHIPGGILSQKFGGKHTLGLGILSTALFTLITPKVAPYGAGPMVTLRFLEGVGEGTTFPALAALLSQWAPPNERSFMSTLVYAGVQLGGVLATFFSGMIMAYTGSWANVFYIFGGMSVVWYLLWNLLCYNDPKSHPFITDKERKYLFDAIGSSERRKDLQTPWTAILTSLPVWALIIGETGHDYGLYLMSNDLPKYMSEIIGVSVSENGVLSALPFLAMYFISLTSSAMADFIIARKIMSRTSVRKVFGSLGAIMPGVGAVAASYVGCDRTIVATLFTVGMTFMGFCYASIRVNPIDLSPNFSATIMALSNGLGCISGMVAPLSVGFLIKNKTLSEWRVVFWIMFGTLFLSNIVYVLFGSGDVQDFNEATVTDIRLKNESDQESETRSENVATKKTISQEIE